MQERHRYHPKEQMVGRQLAPNYRGLSTLTLETRINALQQRVTVLSGTLATLLEYLHEDALAETSDPARARAIEHAYRLLLGDAPDRASKEPSATGDAAR